MAAAALENSQMQLTLYPPLVGDCDVLEDSKRFMSFYITYKKAAHGGYCLRPLFSQEFRQLRLVMLRIG